jgi:hypothetical protein
MEGIEREKGGAGYARAWRGTRGYRIDARFLQTESLLILISLPKVGLLRPNVASRNMVYMNIWLQVGGDRWASRGGVGLATSAT